MSQGWSDSEESAEGMRRAAVLGCPGQLHLREPEELLCSCGLLQLSPGRASSVGMSRRCPSDRSLGRGLAGAWAGSGSGPCGQHLLQEKGGQPGALVMITISLGGKQQFCLMRETGTLLI